LKTPSGKIEFVSQNLAKHFPDDMERPPVPHWIPYGEQHQESLLHPRAKICCWCPIIRVGECMLNWTT